MKSKMHQRKWNNINKCKLNLLETWHSFCSKVVLFNTKMRIHCKRYTNNSDNDDVSVHNIVLWSAIRWFAGFIVTQMCSFIYTQFHKNNLASNWFHRKTLLVDTFIHLDLELLQVIYFKLFDINYYMKMFTLCV